MRPLTFLLGVLLACGIDGPLQSLQAPAHAATAPTMKLCLPSGTTVAYSTACPAGTTSTKKICPSGAIVAYSTACPAASVPLAYGKPAVGLKACISIMNPLDMTQAGASYTVAGFFGPTMLGDVIPQVPGQPSGGVILNDATHRGDGWFGIWVPVECAAGA